MAAAGVAWLMAIDVVKERQETSKTKRTLIKCYLVKGMLPFIRAGAGPLERYGN
jgi:hypothetical protein